MTCKIISEFSKLHKLKNLHKQIPEICETFYLGNWKDVFFRFCRVRKRKGIIRTNYSRFNKKNIC